MKNFALTQPGNIRALNNVIERPVILTKGKRFRLDLAMPGKNETKQTIVFVIRLIYLIIETFRE
ncbi:MAG: hypothetical protein Q7T85_06470 [Nitrosomonas sp.]|nr:hypothetical protein [Nitrosomonas sp.]